MSDTSFFRTIRSLGVERNSDAPIGGVASGLARKWNVDPLLVRAGFLALTFAGGAGAMLYALAWAFLPDEYTGEIHAEELSHGKVTGGFVGAASMLIVAIVVFTGISFTSAFGLIVAIVIGAVCYNAFRKDQPVGTPDDAARSGSSTGPVFSTGNDDEASPATTSAFSAETASIPAPDAASGFTQPYEPVKERVEGPEGTSSAAFQKAHNSKRSVAEDPYAREARQRKEYERDKARQRREEMKARRRLSGRAVSILLAVVLLAIAAFLLLLEVSDSQAHQLPTTIAFASLVLGLVVLAIGIFGRRGGVLSFLALIAMVCAAPVMLINTQSYSNSTSLSDQSWKPESVADIGSGYSVTMGSSSIDFSNFDPGDSSDPIKVSASMADLKLRFGETQKVAIIADVTLSSVQTRLPYDPTVGQVDESNLYYETDPEWEASTDTEDEDWAEQWDDHSNIYVWNNPLQGNDSGTIFLGGITKVSDADVVIELQGSMSSISIRQQINGYPEISPTPSATPATGN